MYLLTSLKTYHLIAQPFLSYQIILRVLLEDLGWVSAGGVRGCSKIIKHSHTSTTLQPGQIQLSKMFLAGPTVNDIDIYYHGRGR
jgi:hypothetical protein